MQSFVIFWRSSSVYLALAGVSRGKISGKEISGRPALLNMGVPKSKGLLGMAEQGGFLQRGAIATESANCKVW